jgi:hypothetical protein
MEKACEELLGRDYASMQDKHQLENMIVEHKAVIANLYPCPHPASSRSTN